MNSLNEALLYFRYFPISKQVQLRRARHGARGRDIEKLKLNPIKLTFFLPSKMCFSLVGDMQTCCYWEDFLGSKSFILAYHTLHILIFKFDPTIGVFFHVKKECGRIENNEWNCKVVKNRFNSGCERNRFRYWYWIWFIASK